MSFPAPTPAARADGKPAARRVFLTAEWRSLVMLNFAVDPALLAPFLPRGTELDLWKGEALASLVGFRFLKCRVLGFAIPFHQDFDEVNLRFYVRRLIGGESRRGVVFIKEIVPRAAIAITARLFYNEQYIALPMRHTVPGSGGAYSYEWRQRGRWHSLSATTRGDAAPMRPGGEEEFIFEHYWGYARQRDGGTVEYQVEHPAWNVRAVAESAIDADIAALYGPQFIEPLRAAPRSAFVADGSPVQVRLGGRVA